MIVEVLVYVAFSLILLCLGAMWGVSLTARRMEDALLLRPGSEDYQAVLHSAGWHHTWIADAPRECDRDAERKPQLTNFN